MSSHVRRQGTTIRMDIIDWNWNQFSSNVLDDTFMGRTPCAYMNYDHCSSEKREKYCDILESSHTIVWSDVLHLHWVKAS